MDRFRLRLPSIETLLWILASLAAFGAFLIFAPTFFNAPAASNTPVAQAATDTPRPTLTPIPTQTSIGLVPGTALTTPLPIPSLAKNQEPFAFIADPTLSGWMLNGDQKPHLGDRNLHAGVYKGQTYQSLLYFDVAKVPPGSTVVYAEVDLTGLSRDYIGATGTWQLKLLKPDLIAGWTDHAVADFSAAGTDAALGQPLGPADLGINQVNQFIFKPEQLGLIQQAINSYGVITFRVDGPSGSADNLFTWDGGGLDLTIGAHPTLRLIAVPGQFTVITNTPTPENVLTAAAQVQTVTAFNATFGTPTPFPRNYATATPIILVTPPPTPANVETRIALAQYATAVALTTGTFTPTPLNWIVVTPVPPTWTPGATATPVSVPVGALTPLSTATPNLPPALLLQTPIPDLLPNSTVPFKGNILFISNRYGGAIPLLMKPDGTLLSALTGMTLYNLAASREVFSPDRNRQASYYIDYNGFQQVSIIDLPTSTTTVITRITKGTAYDAAWSPDGGHIAYVSSETGGDEIYSYDVNAKTTRRLTDSSGLGFPWNKHPSWSPDSQEIVFWSSRSSHAQIWSMNADGTNLQLLAPSPYEDVDPIWVKP